MSALPPRRLKKLHEQILLSQSLAFVLGWLIAVLLPALVIWGPRMLAYPNEGQRNAIIAASIAFLVAHQAIRRLLYRLPGGRSHTLIATHTALVYTITIVVIVLLQLKLSRLLLVSSGLLTFFWLHLEFLATRSYLRPKLAVITGGLADDILQLPGADSRPLQALNLGDTRYDGVVADFQTINADAERFLTQCALNGVAVYNARTAYEALSGRVKINKMVENNLGSLLPSAHYERLKTIFDWLLVLFSLPLTLPIIGVLALIIRIESPGPAIYTQTRIGKGNKPFTLYKFRSMRAGNGEEAEQFTGEDDPRITRVGRVIRQLRLDELPQFFNVLKGDMSLIGPRPEQPGFVNKFNKQIPFYSYRHVVKPGITGWSQVRMGYAADTDAARAKIEFDFYYIKNCSLSLDFFIVLLTVKTIVTGFGAR